MKTETKNTLKEKTQQVAVIAITSSLLLLGLYQGIYSTLGLIEIKTIQARERIVSYIGGDVGDYAWTITVPKTKAEEKSAMKDWSVQDKIIYYADIYGVDKDTALRIAKCESNFNPKAENVNGSATGVYQFIRKTWKNYCEGDVYDADANIICFMRLYPENQGWWECR